MNYILLARGSSLEKARVLAVSADQRLVNRFIGELATGGDPVVEHEEPTGSERLRVVKDSGDEH